MSERDQMMPIKLMRAHCGAFPRAHCWSAANPYYSGHYRTRREASEAAKRIRKKLANKWGAEVSAPGSPQGE